MNHQINNSFAALNDLGRGFCDYAGSMFVQAGVLIVALLLVDLLIRKRVRATFRYWMWMLVFVKLVLPPTLSLPTGIGYWFGDYFVADSGVAHRPAAVAHFEPVKQPAPAAIADASVVPETELGEASYEPAPLVVSDPATTTTISDSPVTPGQNTLTWQGIAFGLWIVGVLAITALLVQRIFFVKGLIAQSEPAKDQLVEVLNQSREQIGLRRKVELRLSHNVTGPAVCGLLHPAILIPKGIPEQLSQEKLRAILIHELAHIKRGDLSVNCVQTVLQIAYFYNPFVWLANMVVRRIREQAVDEMALVALGAEVKSYSNTLIDVAEMAFSRPAFSLRLVGVVESKKALSQRIKHILNRPIPKTAKLGILGLMTVLIFGVLLLPMARAQKQSVDDTAVVSDWDKDGLENRLEAELGTNPKSSDTDGDGLSDFHEVHKYLTDPAKRDTDGDGVPDGDWNERREYAYSVRTVLQFMPPFDKAALNDEYQDARVLEETDDYIEIEVIHYPLTTTHESIEENPNWQQDYAGMTEYLKPGVTTNWDAKMKQDLIAELRTAGIRIDELTDKEVVERVSSWLIKRSRSLDKVFTTYYVHFPDGQPSVYPGLESAFEHEFGRDKENYDWTMDQHFDHELLGKGMFYNKTHGSCTSFAIYLATVLRALGIPTRMIIGVPAVDPSDREQLILVNKHITHNKVREIMLAGFRGVTEGFTAHTFNEVYVGNRWRRLNYNKLGQPILDQHLFGLHTHLYTFNDLSEADLARTWGWRYGKGEKNSVLTHSNPYSAVALSDHFGYHCDLANPPLAAEDLSASPLPNIFILEPAKREPSDFSIWDEVIARVERTTYNKTGRLHQKECCDDIFNGVFTKKPGDVIVLLFSLDTKERIPADYEDLLPKPWQEIEADLQEGNSVELNGNARDSNIILLAAPKREQLRQLIRESELLRLNKTGQVERRKPLVRKRQPSSDLPNIYVLSPSSVSLFGEIFDMVQDVTSNKTGRYHEKKSYDDILIDGIWNRKPGDIIVLLFCLDSPHRIPAEYADLLPKPWPQIQAALKQGKTVELKGEARQLNVILLAAPTSAQLRSLVEESKLLKPSAKPSQSGVQMSGFSATLPNGVTVELVGVCEHPSEGKQWWKPDGTLLKEAPYDEFVETPFQLENLYPGIYENFQRIELALRITTRTETPLRIGWRMESPGSMFLMKNISNKGHVSPQLKALLVEVPFKDGTIEIKLVINGSWIRIKNISLRPGVKTDVQIETERPDVLQVPSEKYPTIPSAVEAAEDGDTIVLDASAQNKSNVSTGKSSPYGATLASGVTVELLGVCEHPSKSKRWWRPDGNDFTEIPFSKFHCKVYPDDTEQAREMALRLWGPDNIVNQTDVVWKISDCTSSSGNIGDRDEDDNQIMHTWAVAFICDAERKSLDFRVGVAAGQWRNVAGAPPTGETTNDSLNDRPVIFYPAYERDGLVVASVAHLIDQMQSRLVAVDNAGQIHTARRSSASKGDELTGSTCTFEMSLGEIKSFQLQTRPYEWVTFENVSLRQGVKTDVIVGFPRDAPTSFSLGPAR